MELNNLLQDSSQKEKLASRFRERVREKSESWGTHIDGITDDDIYESFLKLDDTHKIIIFEWYVNGKTQYEIGKRFNVSAGRIGVKIMKAERQMLGRLNKGISRDETDKLKLPNGMLIFRGGSRIETVEELVANTGVDLDNLKSEGPEENELFNTLMRMFMPKGQTDVDEAMYELDLPVRTINSLRRNGISNIKDLVSFINGELGDLKIRGIGPEFFNQIKLKLIEKGYINGEQ